MNTLFDRLREVFISVLPITAIVTVLHLTVTPLGPFVYLRFLLGTVLIVLGLTAFLQGVDTGITPIGQMMGQVIARSGKGLFVVLSSLFLGFFVSVAEPDLHILAAQVAAVTENAVTRPALVVVVSVGIALMLSAGLLRILTELPLRRLLAFLYLGILALSLFTSRAFLAISFDASGATTGALTVPFILALGVGVSSMKPKTGDDTDSFGLVAIASVGAIFSLMLMNILTGTDRLSGSIRIAADTGGQLWEPFLSAAPHAAAEVFFALLPLLVIYLAVHTFSRQPHDRFAETLLGAAFAYIGLVLFMTGVSASFMDVGARVGYGLAALGNPAYLIGAGFLLGFVTILVEPAVYVLTHQIQEVTRGAIRRKDVTAALAVGVGFSVALSMVRILIPDVQLWHYLLPGYALSLLMMYAVPEIFVGIAFDSGGVASGPMTATFVLAFAQGAAEQIPHADVLVDGFGMIAMVAMTPILTLQLLGLLYRLRGSGRQHSGS